jgi:hypothetical protein
MSGSLLLTLRMLLSRESEGKGSYKIESNQKNEFIELKIGVIVRVWDPADNEVDSHNAALLDIVFRSGPGELRNGTPSIMHCQNGGSMPTVSNDPKARIQVPNRRTPRRNRSQYQAVCLTWIELTVESQSDTRIITVCIVKSVVISWSIGPISIESPVKQCPVARVLESPQVCIIHHNKLDWIC